VGYLYCFVKWIYGVEDLTMKCEKCKKTVTSAVCIGVGKYKCTDCNNMEKYEAGEEGFFICPVCGKADSPTNWIGGLPKELCFNCSFWTEVIEEYKKGNKVVIDGHAYVIGNEEARGGFRGFGGRSFIIEFYDSRQTIVSTNLWHNGEIPKRFRDKLPDNARFIK